MRKHLCNFLFFSFFIKEPVELNELQQKHWATLIDWVEQRYVLELKITIYMYGCKFQ